MSRLIDPIARAEMLMKPGTKASDVCEGFSVICDNVVIEANGPRIVHKTPRQLFQI